MIAVEPVARGTGLGRRLIKAIEQEASRLGAKLISLGADDAAGFYERLGYVRSGNAFHKRIGPQ